MIKLFYLTGLLILFITCQTPAQTTNSLQQKIQQIISAKNAEVGVSIVGDNGKDVLSINGNGRFPMQSVFKFHIGLAVLSEVDKGKLSLD
jgi:beta-lactamase class A/beta-lactamase class A VEB